MRIFFDAAEMQAKGTAPDELKKIMRDRLKTGTYKAPERAGLSYMLSPILRTYVNPEESDRVATSNNPHVMYYAPNVSNEDIAGIRNWPAPPSSKRAASFRAATDCSGSSLIAPLSLSGGLGSPVAYFQLPHQPIMLAGAPLLCPFFPSNFHLSSPGTGSQPPESRFCQAACTRPSADRWGLFGRTAAALSLTKYLASIAFPQCPIPFRVETDPAGRRD
ncbi:MAG: hypothetical protein MUC57_18160 [Desulfobacterales bacterium]|jgi:hypothetical protein|nr:hypothetical protein [Desulfobacterales bacterium]